MRGVEIALSAAIPHAGGRLEFPGCLSSPITAVSYRILDGQGRLTLAEDTGGVEGEIRLVGQDVFCFFGVQ